MKSDSERSCADPAEVSAIVMSLLDHLDAMVAYWDANQVCVFANDAYRDWFGKTKDEVVGLTMKELLGPLYDKNLPYITAALKGQKQVFEREIPCPDGRVRSSLATYVPRVIDGEVRGIFVHVADVTSLKILERDLQAAKTRAEFLATHDFLTGLPNRVLLIDRIMQAIGQARRTRQMVAIMSFDLDGFKDVNDNYGHAVGDRLLVEIAARIASSLRGSDTVTRMGGDEFILVVPAVDSRSHIESMVERLLEAVRQPFETGHASVTPNASIGIALCPDHGDTADDLLANSDRALYAAKKAGRNRYAFAGPDEARKPDVI